MKKLLNAPIIFAFTNSDGLAELLSAALSDSRRTEQDSRPFLTKILNQATEMRIDMDEIGGETRTLWDYLGRVRRARSGVIHNAALAARADAERSLQVASLIVEELYPQLRRTFSAKRPL